MNDYRKLSGEISDWIKVYAENNKIKSLIIGISGGIDSALVSTLCAKTGLDTYVISLPINQKKDQLLRAKKHYEWLNENYSNVKFIEKDLSGIFLEFCKNFSEEEKTDLSLANSRSRLRMISLYQLASTKSGIVVGTGNKIEDFGIGFFTKYGDGGVDISPIADLTKTEVRKISKELGIIKEILEARPTDGLWEDDRSDEDQIGASYEELEFVMDFKNNPDLLNDREKHVLAIYNKLHLSNQHKMIAVPIFKKMI